MKRGDGLKRTVGLARGPLSLGRKTPLTRTAAKRAPRQPAQEPRGATKTGDWSADTRALVAERSGGRCEIGIVGKCTGAATDLHHRQARRSQRHDVANALHCCRRDHSDAAHGQPALAMHMGWIVSQYADPSTAPVNLHGRWVTFTADGGYEDAEAPL